jgi:NAD(P)H-nitrite reductase large subunit
VITYRDIADTEAMIDASRSYKQAVVIGGGLLGLEAANGLALRGMDVTVVHLMPWLMERQLDRTAADMLQRISKRKVFTSASKRRRKRWSPAATAAWPASSSRRARPCRHSSS